MAGGGCRARCAARMATKIRLIRLEPQKNITFDLTQKEPTVVLRVHNT